MQLCHLFSPKHFGSILLDYLFFFPGLCSSELQCVSIKPLPPFPSAAAEDRGSKPAAAGRAGAGGGQSWWPLRRWGSASSPSPALPLRHPVLEPNAAGSRPGKGFFLEDTSLVVPLTRGRRGPGGLQHPKDAQRLQIPLYPVLPPSLPELPVQS